MAGWSFDIVMGVILGAFLAALPLLVVELLVGVPTWVAVTAQVAGACAGVRFMRRARTETGAAWLTRPSR